MCRQMYSVAIVLTVLHVISCAPPDFISKCASDDAKCIKENTMKGVPILAKGLPENGVEPLDPMTIKSVNASEGSIYFVLNDITLTGMKDCQVKKAYRDKAKSKLFLKMLCSGKMDGNYVLKGSVLILPLEGDGKIHVDLKSTEFSIEADLVEKVHDDGKKYWHIKSWQHGFEFKDKSDVVFENLFNGNELLGRAARELIATNGNEVINEIGRPVIKILIAKVVKNINNLFKTSPIDEIALD